jgi:Cdc6-like AAA superfamily ATPase
MTDKLFEFSSIIKNEEPLRLDYLPTDVLFRPDQLKAIAYAMHKKSNILCLGGTGVGKTVCAKYIANEINKQFPHQQVVYINCGEQNTPKKVLTEITHKLNIIKIPSRLTEYELIKILEEVDSDKNYLIMDEFDQMGDIQFARMVKILEGLKLHATFITNKTVFPSTLPPEIAHRLAWNVERFERYNPDQVYNILDSRVKLSFINGALEEPNLRKLSALVVRDNESDVRFGLQVLYTAGKITETKRSKQISYPILEKSLKEVKSSILMETLMSLSDSNKLIILTLGYTPHSSSTLYRVYMTIAKKFQITTPESYVTFWRRLNQLEKDYSLLLTQESPANHGKRGGKSLKVFPLIPGDLFNEIKTKLEESIGVVMPTQHQESLEA